MINDLKNKYKNNEISKDDFIKQMFMVHSVLFEYADILEDTDIKSINIEDKKVVMQTRTDNIKIICDSLDKRAMPIEILNFGQYETDELNLLKELNTDNSVIFDIGANIGYYSMVLGNYNKDCKIYAFEPIPYTFDYLNSNIKINGITNVVTNQSALSDENGETIFYYSRELSVNSSMKDLNKEFAKEKIRCKIQKMDDFIKENNICKVDLIKCDTEGSEYLVFKGAKETLKKYKPAVFTEMLRKWSKSFDYNPNEIIALFREIGYKCYVIKKDKIQEFKYMDENTIDTNFIFLHPCKHKRFIENKEIR